MAEETHQEDQSGRTNSSDDVRERLVEVAKDLLSQAANGTVRAGNTTQKLDVSRYIDPGLHEIDCRNLFRRLPLMLAASCEIAGPGQFKTIEVTGVSVLIVRNADGNARAFLNSCTHRGAKLAEGSGTANRFTCPYHAWTFSTSGELVALPLEHEFGQFNKSDHGLLALPVYESAGLIWVTLSQEPLVTAPDLLQGFDQLLSSWKLETWHVVKQNYLPGTNWKLAFDAHLEFYHLPALHGASFGPNIGNRASHYTWGPHQRLILPSLKHKEKPSAQNLFDQADKPVDSWTDLTLMLGEWILFPNVSINSFDAGGRGILISQVVPGLRVNESVTIQTYLTADKLEGNNLELAEQNATFLAHVVGTEDLPNSAGQEQNLATGIQDKIVFGANEFGLQHFHHWLEALSEAENSEITEVLGYRPGWSNLTA